MLVVRKVSVSRMLSLPNDSYMFRPVAPAAAAHPHPLQEVEMETYAGAAAGLRETSLLSNKHSCVHLTLTIHYYFYILSPLMSSTRRTAKSLTQI